MKKRILSLLTIFLCLLSGCGAKEQPISIDVVPIEETEMIEGEKENIKVEKIVQNYNAYLNIAETSGEKNIAISPTSLNYTLGMVSMGANKDTKTSFEDYFLLDLKNVYMRQIELSKAWKSNDDVEILVSNMIACDKDVPLLDTYVQNVEETYQAQIVNHLSFAKESELVVNEMDKFCNESTKGMIPKIASKEDIENSKLAFLNALYFNGKWEDKFEESNVKQEDFFNGDGTTSEVTMMKQTGHCYFEGGNAIGFSKNYAGGNFEFVGILPDDSICDENGNFDMTKIDLDAFLNSRTHEYDVVYKFPKFKLESDIDLSKSLSSTSLKNIFSPYADFSNLSECSLFVSSAKQKVVIDVNEEGTEAAAVTFVGMKLTSTNHDMPIIKYVSLDRPFLFLIYDKVNDEALFIGRITNM